jgi:hypothetical protein
MKCPKCGNPGRKAFKGYCSKVHRDLDKKPQAIVLECALCGRPVVRSSSRVSKGGKVYCVRCPKNSGETHPNWHEGQYLNPAGYRLVLVTGDYKLEHRHTWEQWNHACILPSVGGIVHVHHINMVKTDNRPQNLVVLTGEEHGRIHRLIDAKKYEAAKCILIKACEQQVFFLVHLEHLEHIRNTSLPNILSGT